VARAVELLPRKPKALSSNASNTHKKEYSLRKPATNFMTETGVGEGFGVGEGLDKPMEKEKKKKNERGPIQPGRKYLHATYPTKV
jgi:hypothetical protein